MDMNIEKFNVLLTSEKDESELVTALRKLTILGNPEDIVAATTGANVLWSSGWI
jgi:hypothetical protein